MMLQRTNHCFHHNLSFTGSLLRPCSRANKFIQKCRYLSTVRGERRQNKQTFGVVMDIDGVLHRGPQVISKAPEAVRKLQIRRVPHLFMTNGGGVLESERAASLSSKLGVSIGGEQMQLAHSPMRNLVSMYGQKTILVSGKSSSKTIAKHYGFQKIVSVDELHQHHPEMFPDTRPPATPGDAELYEEPISAILVFMDPLQWSRDLQILCDVLRSDGRPGTLVEDQVVPIFLSCPDFEYVSEYHIPRFGSGVFGRLLEHLYEKTTQKKLNSTWFGKPDKLSYLHAESALDKQAARLGYSGVHRYYMIGDNPLSDIAGALAAGKSWRGVLVRTGVYTNNLMGQKPHHVVDCISSAIDLIFQLEEKEEQNRKDAEFQV